MPINKQLETFACHSAHPCHCHAWRCCVFGISGTVNTFNLTVINSTATCTVYTAPAASGKSFPWWAGLILGLGLALILCMAVCGLLLWLRRRKRHRADANARKTAAQHSTETVSNPLHLAGPFNVGAPLGSGMGVTDDSAMIVPKFTSAPGDASSKPPLQLQRQQTASAPPDIYEANMKINATPMPGLMQQGSNGSDPDNYRRQSSGNEKTSAASASSSIISQRCRNSAGAPVGSVPELFRQRSHMPLDEVELGPLLGRGAYGRVFKGSAVPAV